MYSSKLPVLVARSAPVLISNIKRSIRHVGLSGCLAGSIVAVLAAGAVQVQAEVQVKPAVTPAPVNKTVPASSAVKSPAIKPVAKASICEINTRAQLVQLLSGRRPFGFLRKMRGLSGAEQRKLRRLVVRRADFKALKAFYDNADAGLIWTGAQGITAKGQAVLALFRKAGDYGLTPSDYLVQPLASLLQQAGQCQRPADVARAELALGLAALIYARHARGGRIEISELIEQVDRRASLLPAARVLTQLAKLSHPARYLLGLHPHHPQYHALVQALKRARQARNGARNTLLPAGPLLRIGMRHPQVAILRRRLGLADGPKQSDGKQQVGQKIGQKTAQKTNKTAMLFDRKLLQAVRRFQRRHGLRPDGLIGARTRQVLNRGKGKLVNRILVNLERWRWMPRQFGTQYIQVNIPEFKLRMVKRGRVIHQERVIVGKLTNMTPVFSDQMERVVINPSWHVPENIVLTEMRGRIPRGYQGKYIGGKLYVTQPPGPGNALGKVKFLFPNHHAVYMHDTPTRHLFRKSVRTFSHGCMRVRHPEKLAALVLKQDAGWNDRQVRRAFAGLETQKVELKRKIPVHITYFTVWADKAGRVRAYNDVYLHDARIAHALKLTRILPKSVRRLDRILAAHKARQERKKRIARLSPRVRRQYQASRVRRQYQVERTRPNVYTKRRKKARVRRRYARPRTQPVYKKRNYSSNYNSYYRSRSWGWRSSAFGF